MASKQSGLDLEAATSALQEEISAAIKANHAKNIAAEKEERRNIANASKEAEAIKAAHKKKNDRKKAVCKAVAKHRAAKRLRMGNTEYTKPEAIEHWFRRNKYKDNVKAAKKEAEALHVEAMTMQGDSVDVAALEDLLSSCLP